MHEHKYAVIVKGAGTEHQDLLANMGSDHPYAPFEVGQFYMVKGVEYRITKVGREIKLIDLPRLDREGSGINSEEAILDLTILVVEK
jgi:hypothetical protein